MSATDPLSDKGGLRYGCNTRTFNVAPLAEQGLPDYEYASWSAMFAPAGLPADIGRKLHQVFTQVMADPAMQTFAASAGIIP